MQLQFRLLCVLAACLITNTVTQDVSETGCGCNGINPSDALVECESGCDQTYGRIEDATICRNACSTYLRENLGCELVSTAKRSRIAFALELIEGGEEEDLDSPKSHLLRRDLSGCLGDCDRTFGLAARFCPNAFRPLGKAAL